MSWKNRYGIITSTDQLIIGDFISWNGQGHGRRYGKISNIIKNTASAAFTENRVKALDPEFQNKKYHTSVTICISSGVRRELI